MGGARPKQAMPLGGHAERVQSREVHVSEAKGSNTQVREVKVRQAEVGETKVRETNVDEDGGKKAKGD